MDPKLNPATAEIQALRNQVADRDKQILSLEVNLHFNLVQLKLYVYYIFPLNESVCREETLYQNYVSHKFPGF